VRRSRLGQLVAGAVCLLQAAVLAGLSVFYVVELSAGAGSDRMRVVSSTVLILVLAAGLALLGRLWLVGSGRPATPTVVWALLLVPVAVGMAQSGQVLICVGLLGLVVLTLAAVAASWGGEPRSD